MSLSRRSTKAGGANVTARAAAMGMSSALLVASITQALVGSAIAASTIVSAGFGGTTGTANVSGVEYAKGGAALTLTVVTDTTVNCVSLSGAHTGASSVPSSSDVTSKTWTFATTAMTGVDGVRTTTVTASFDPGCASADATTTAAYTVDNTAPTVTGTKSPPNNSHGWNNTAVTVNWSATDAGSGVASGPTPATSSQTTNTGGINKTSTATDRVGNVGNGSSIVRVDLTLPSITSTVNPAPNANGWNNTNVAVSFSCSDGQSGIETCTSSSSFTSNVTGAVVTGTAADFASNTKSTSVTVNVDKNAPTISGAPAGSPNAAGWYNADVTMHWTCTDTGGSGFAAGACADSTLSTEGTGLTASKSVSDLAGNSSSSATSSPAVNLDKTAPSTTATPSVGGGGSTVTVSLSATDGLSGVKTTQYKLDGNAPQTYDPTNPPAFTSQGGHTLEYWSVDNADNMETHHVYTTSIDTVNPTITAAQAPAANSDGWNNTDVVVTFTCSDAGSGVANCTAPVTVSGEGAGQTVSGTATDNAGNSASTTATVSVDKTAPFVSGSASPAANSNGWNSTDVVVTFTCSDGLSGVGSCPAPQTLGEGADQSASGSAFDKAGNSSSASVDSIDVDETAPAVSVAGVVAGGTYQQGSYLASCSTTDALSGVAVPASLSTTGGPTGSVTLTCTGAVDLAGNGQGAPVSVHITVTGTSTGGGGGSFKFGGFLPPVAGNGAVNVVRPGTAVLVRFSLGGFRGGRIFASGYPAMAAWNCSGTPAGGDLQRVDWPWGINLWYDRHSDMYGFYWFTSPWWTGCRTLVLKFSDGSSAVAYFNFVRHDRLDGNGHGGNGHGGNGFDGDNNHGYSGNNGHH